MRGAWCGCAVVTLPPMLSSYPEIPIVSRVCGSKSTAIGISVSAAYVSSPLGTTFTHALAEGSLRRNRVNSRANSERHGSVANSA